AAPGTVVLINLLLKAQAGTPSAAIYGISSTALVNISGPTYGAGVAVPPYTTQTPGLVPFAGVLMVILGNDVPPQIWDGRSLKPIVNNYTAAGDIPIWTASAVETV